MIQDVYLVLDDFGGRIGSAWRENQISRPHIGVNEGNGMGYLKLVILVLAYAVIPPAFAQTCCPARRLAFRLPSRPHVAPLIGELVGALGRLVDGLIVRTPDTRNRSRPYP